MVMRLAALGAATWGLSGCYYDAGLGLGYYDDGYSYYDCDPYGGFDSYYDCDYRNGFYNIGYGGGWYQDYYYPGHGFYIFDRGGRRYQMYDNHRRYWGNRRHEWYREHHGRRDGGRGWGDNDGDRRDGWRDRDGRRDGRDGRRDGRRGRDLDGSYGATPVPGVVTPGAGDPRAGNPDGSGWGRRGDGRRGEGRGERRRGWQGENRGAVPAPVPGQPETAPQPGNWRRGPRGDGGGEMRRTPRGGGEGRRGNWQPPVQPAPDAGAPPPPQQRQQGRAERILRGEPRAPRGDRPQRQED